MIGQLADRMATAMAKRKFEVGQRAWRFDENRRVYAPNGSGGPIFAKHFAEHRVLEINSHSYVIGAIDNDGKVHASVPGKIGFQKAEKEFLTDTEREDAIWLNEHRYRIVRKVEYTTGANFRKIAEIVGYKPEEK
jgi:hypothetical protein